MTYVGETERKLLNASLKASSNAHVLWGFPVGAAVIAENGQTYEGCNVESWISGLGTCAERSAINHAVLHGNQRITMLALVIDVSSKNHPRPCGACLQYLSDFSAGSDIRVIMARAMEGEILAETIEVKNLSELYPFPYKK